MSEREGWSDNGVSERGVKEGKASPHGAVRGRGSCVRQADPHLGSGGAEEVKRNECPP